MEKDGSDLFSGGSIKDLIRERNRIQQEVEKNANDRMEYFRKYESADLRREYASTFKKAKIGLINLFSKLVEKITALVQKMKDSKFKGFLLKLLKAAQSGLSTSKTLNNYDPRRVDELKANAKSIQADLDRIQSQYQANEAFINFCDDMEIAY